MKLKLALQKKTFSYSFCILTEYSSAFMLSNKRESRSMTLLDIDAYINKHSLHVKIARGLLCAFSF